MWVPNPSLIREKLGVGRPPIVWCWAKGVVYGKGVSGLFYSSRWGYFLIFPLCRSPSVRFWISYRCDCSVCGYRCLAVGVSVGGEVFRSHRYPHLGQPLSPPESFFFSSLRISLFPGSFLQTKALESLKELRVKLGERAKEIHTQGTLILHSGL